MTTPLHNNLANALVRIAHAIRNDQIDGVEIRWRVGEEPSVAILLKQPVEFIQLNMTIDNPEKTT